MNSEELEKSLKTEFESHLKTVLAEMQQELEGFQERFESEIENHKARLGEVLQNFSTRLKTDKEFDEGFRETVVEHLRLARDEGARITAEAITEAEQMEKESAAPAVSFNELRDAVSEISNQNSQAEILKSLVNHAGQYVPRGAFFIIKNDHFIGWRVFGKEADTDDQAVREVFFSVSDSTVPGESVRSLATVESSYGTYDDDAAYLEKLEFGQPDRMYAIPLVARGRGVAVLYADYGHGGTSVNIEALETLMRVAGLTVELLAASRGAKMQPEKPDDFEETAASPEESKSFETSELQNNSYKFENTQDEFENKQPENFSYQQTDNLQSPNELPAQPAEEFYHPSVEQNKTESQQPDYSSEQNYSAETNKEETENYQNYSAPQDDYFSPAHESEPLKESLPDYSTNEFQTGKSESLWNQPSETNGYSQNYSNEETPQKESSSYETTDNQSDFHIPAAAGGFDFKPSQSKEYENPVEEEEQSSLTEPPQFDVSRFEAEKSALPVNENYSTAETSETYNSFEPQPEVKETPYVEPVETVSQSVVSQPVKTRFSERNVDLPIDVAEDERRLHNDARRFARLLVSEIKLYNEPKVNEGRNSYDLYDRLREAIDRSREMYDKRVQPPVAAKFDYFHYELVNSLAEGDESKLGGSYPGANI